MIRQVLNVDSYWKVIVYYNIDYNLFDYIVTDLRAIGISTRTIRKIYRTMSSHRAKGVTITHKKIPCSVVLFNTHSNKYDYVNTIVHEAEHIKQAMLAYYNVDDADEPPAYTVGYLVMKLLSMMKLIC